jgi:K+-sensing histidine kinase KdpD
VLIAALAIVPRALRRERFIVTVTFVQLAFFVATYFVTPHDFSWHIMTSWQRLTRQVQIPITVVCVLLLAQFVVRGEDARHAEARPDQL